MGEGVPLLSRCCDLILLTLLSTAMFGFVGLFGANFIFNLFGLVP